MTAPATAPGNPLLEGIRVLDLSRLLPGPFCTLYLAQLGAEVIKIEEPQGGDYARALDPELFAQINRGKQSVTLDLRQPEAVAALKALVRESDVLIESFRPGVMDKLGCGYDELRAVNPKLVFASLTGYGHTGPYRDRAGHDMNYLGYAGVLDQIGAAGGPPVLSNVQIADLAGGALTCAIGILSAVIGARSSGQGCFVDAGMLDGSLTMQVVALSTLRGSGATRARGQDMLTGALPNYSLYRCRDGKYLTIGALEPKFFQRLLAVLQQELLPAPLRAALQSAVGALKGGKGSRRKDPAARPESANANAAIEKMTALLADPGRARRVLMPVRLALKAVFRLKTRDEWERLLVPADACVGSLLRLEEALANEQVQARGLVETIDGKPAFRNPLRFVGAETTGGTAPALGEHTEAVLRAVGVPEDRIRNGMRRD